MGVSVSKPSLLLLVLAALLAGCFFETRDPPPPELGGGCDFDFEFNDSWEDVLRNMEGALECGDASEYMGVIAQQFLYLPPPILAANNPQVFAEPWTVDREQLFINNTFASARFQASLADSIISGPTPDGNFILLTAGYRIAEVDSEGNPTGVEYADVAEYRFELASGLVVLLSWRDTESLSNPFGARRADDGGGV